MRSDCCWTSPLGRLGWLLALLPLGAGAATDDPRRDAAVTAVASVLPSVVNIATETLVRVSDPFEELLRDFWGPYYRSRPPRAQYSLGSGVIIDETGYVLTNDHVVRRASRIWVRISEGGEGAEYEAEVVRSSDRNDVALLRIKCEEGQTFRAARFAEDDDLLLGETVLALGNPFGLGGSVSRGILSSKSRRPPVEGLSMDIADWLQTDAAINPGNSGGPLVNLRGEVIGMNIAVYREGQGIGFAIPIRLVKQALAEIFSPEMNRLWFGARIRPAGDDLIVDSIEPESPAARAGLNPGDRIRRINRKSPRGYIDFMLELNRAGVGQTVALELDRAGTVRTVSLRLVPETEVFNPALIKRRLGLSVQELTLDLAEALGLLVQEGLLIADVEEGSAARKAGLGSGQVILSLDGVPARDVVSAARWLARKDRGERVDLVVLAQDRRGPFVRARQVEVQLEIR